MRSRRDPRGLDEIDRSLLELLQADCKATLARMGEQVGLSAPAVVERVKRLEHDGFIEGYHARLNARLLGLDVCAFISVWTTRARAMQLLTEELSSFEDVLECHHVTGDPTLLIKVRTRNTQSLERLISAVRSLPGVERTETNVVLSTLVEHPGLGLASVAAEARDASKADERTRADS